MCKYLKIEHMMCVVDSKEAVDGFRYSDIKLVEYEISQGSVSTI